MKPRRFSSFQAVKADILQRIRLREWPPGETIPGEETLAGLYGCSRNTVNRALRELAEAGVVERRRRAGTRVALQPAQTTQLRIPIVRREIEERGAVYRYALLERSLQRAPVLVRGKLSLPRDAEVLHVRCLHYADETSYQYEDRWINPAAVPTARQVSFEAVSPNEWLVETEPLVRVEHILSAVNADPQQAALMEVAAGDALFVVERRTWSEKQVITYVKLYHPGSAYRMVSRS